MERYTSTVDGVRVHFADGTSAEGDFLVGADGIRSAVRRQRAPQAQTMDAGITAIYGRLPIEVAVKIAPQEALTDIFAVASDERKVFLGAGAVRFPSRPDEAAKSLDPLARLDPQEDYVVCIVGGRHEFFSRARRGMPGAELQRIAVDAVGSWPGSAGSLVQCGIPEAFFLVEMHTSIPCELDEPTNVTLLGDAIHAMTPTLGRGANLAMRDGAMLGRTLKSVAEGDRSLAEALGSYEREMLQYGFGVVREAAAVGTQRMAQNPLPM